RPWFTVPGAAGPTGPPSGYVLGHRAFAVSQPQALNEHPGCWIDPTQRHGQVTASQPHPVSGIQTIELVVASWIHDWKANLHVAGIPDVSAGVPYAPGKFDAFMRVPESPCPATRGIKNSAGSN